MLIYVPLEHIEGRYTVHMDRDIEAYLNAQDIEYVKVMPTTETPPLPEGQFLNAAFTSKFKAMQIAEISAMFESGKINDGDTIFFSDIWFPGIESIAYMKYFTKKDVKITGIIHAGSFTDTDFVSTSWKVEYAAGFHINDDYEGGEFVVYENGKQRIIGKQIGVPYIFSSEVGHKINKVKSKIRYSIIVFIYNNSIDKRILI